MNDGGKGERVKKKGEKGEKVNDGGKGEEVKKEEVGHLVLHLVTTQTAVGPVPDDGSGCQLVQHLTHAHTVICNTILGIIQCILLYLLVHL